MVMGLLHYYGGDAACASLLYEFNPYPLQPQMVTRRFCEVLGTANAQSQLLDLPIP